MARRRRLVAPDQSELDKIDEGFAAKPPLGNSVTPPIAQGAGEAAALAGMANVTDRAAAARDATQAQNWREAEEAGHAVQAIPISQIDADYLRRDRVVDDQEEMEELVASVQSQGLRSPIEVVATDEGFGLISGHRRLKAFRNLAVSDDRFQQIPAFVRSHDTSADAYLSMVEENEVRANLTHYERGRIAVLAAQHGVFPSVADAVARLFGNASKSKRSKVRSFASVHEALGDLLKFPTDLSEKAGLQLAAALRDGAQKALRQVLAASSYGTADDEWKALEAALGQLGAATKDPSKGGRPSEVTKLPPVELEGGGKLVGQVSPTGLKIDVKGRAVDAATLEMILADIQNRLG
jgi:ParB family chromosome partitioning protein